MSRVAAATGASANDGYRWRVLGVVMVGTFMSALDSSIVKRVAAEHDGEFSAPAWTISSGW